MNWGKDKYTGRLRKHADFRKIKKDVTFTDKAF